MARYSNNPLDKAGQKSYSFVADDIATILRI
jgi:hypothetical protein